MIVTPFPGFFVARTLEDMYRSWMLVGMVVMMLAVDALAAATPTADPAYIPIQVGARPHDVVTVRPGDHLWKISESYLQVTTGTEPDDSDVVPYWRLTIETNIDDLRSGDPDLIFPGEQVRMPSPARPSSG